MDNSLFNFNFNDLMDKINSIKSNIKKYDLNTEEGYETFIKDAAEIRMNLLNSDSKFANEYLVNILDDLVQRAMKNYSEKKKMEEVEKNLNSTVDSIVKNEVNRNVSENHGRVNHGQGVVDNLSNKKGIEYPSDNLNYKQKRNVWKLVDEYMDTKVIPYLDNNVSEEMIDDMSSGLFEFGAWILTKDN